MSMLASRPLMFIAIVVMGFTANTFAGYSAIAPNTAFEPVDVLTHETPQADLLTKYAAANVTRSDFDETNIMSVAPAAGEQLKASTLRRGTQSYTETNGISAYNDAIHVPLPAAVYTGTMTLLGTGVIGALRRRRK